MPNYSYADCLQTAYRINWTIDQVIANQHSLISPGAGCQPDSPARTAPRA